ncbi:MAG: DUF1569 domain-containing protein [Chitinophagaceae bacterium]|nr:DUF1569 domain-containing protein [Chitinophagaceae bacterium]
MDKTAKLNFIQNELITLLSQLVAGKSSNWGKMNAQQMVEHLSDFFRVSTKKISFPLVTPAEHLPKYKEFLLSDKMFRENTKAPMLPDEPFALKELSMQQAIEKLQEEINSFIAFFESANPGTTSQHPVFGDLNYEEWILLHYKHVVHHARQFGLA